MIDRINKNINQLQIENQRLNQELSDNKRKIKEITKEYSDYKSSRETNVQLFYICYIYNDKIVKRCIK